jgi:ribosomal protein S14
MLAEIEKRLEGFEGEERRERASLVERLAELAVGEDRENFSRLAAALDALEAYEGARPAAGRASEERTARIPEHPVADARLARAQIVLRALMDRARLREESFPSGEVAKALGISRERLRQMRERGKIVGIVGGERRSTLYPYWQFSAKGRILDGVEEVVEAAREAEMDPETLHFFMTEPNDRLGGKEPAELLKDGEAGRVAWVLRTSGLGGF